MHEIMRSPFAFWGDYHGEVVWMVIKTPVEVLHNRQRDKDLNEERFVGIFLSITFLLIIVVTYFIVRWLI